MSTSTKVWTFFCPSLIGYLPQVSKSNPLAREEVSILTLSKNDTLRCCAQKVADPCTRVPVTKPAQAVLLKPAGTQGSQGPRSARITRTTSGAIRNAWSTLGIGSMGVRFS